MTLGSFRCTFDTQVHLYYMGLDKKDIRKEIDKIDTELAYLAVRYEPMPSTLLNDRSFLVTLLKTK